MNIKFDELTKSLAQSVTPRAALKKFGLGLAGIALACFGLANKAEAKPPAIPRWCDQTTRSVAAENAIPTCLPMTRTGGVARVPAASLAADSTSPLERWDMHLVVAPWAPWSANAERRSNNLASASPVWR
jgi:hypothetical protein